MALPTPSTGGSSVYVSENPSRVGASRLVPRRHPGKETGNDGTWQDDDDADGDGD
ncbi:hypothetical protein MCOR31_011342 [Pyricularia oryzae]|nr:hypothetical protein MCOR31_011342 [Pyricularia oryzae]